MSSWPELSYEIIELANNEVKKEHKNWKTLKNESNLGSIKISGARSDGLFDVYFLNQQGVKIFWWYKFKIGASPWNGTFQIRSELDYKSKYLV